MIYLHYTSTYLHHKSIETLLRNKGPVYTYVSIIVIISFIDVLAYSLLDITLTPSTGGNNEKTVWENIIS